MKNFLRPYRRGIQLSPLTQTQRRSFISGFSQKSDFRTRSATMDVSLNEVKGLRVAVEGCGHGTLHAIYDQIQKGCHERGWESIDLLIIGGDFQAVRNASDLNTMAVPVKYRKMADFYEYYSGIRKAPYLTIFVGGNHEASSYMWELYYGGWVAPNIYYMGAANVVRLGPLRIAGMSGIWKGYDYGKHHYERLPYNDSDIRSIFHVRELDVRKLLQLRTQVDVGISHDWPRAIEKHGNERSLFSKKPFFEPESKDGTLGNLAAKYVMDRLRPPYWFSAHLHCKYTAIKDYERSQATIDASETRQNPVTTQIMASNQTVTKNPDEIDLNLSDEEGNNSDSERQNGGAAITENDLPKVTAETSAQIPTSNSTITKNPDEIDLGLSDDDEATSVPESQNHGGEVGIRDGIAPELVNPVPDDVRAQLPASFMKSKPKDTQEPGQPTPPMIQNKIVRFLALDKCEPHRRFLQLLEIEPFSAAPSNGTHSNTEANYGSENKPQYKLEYDPEWLAITRVFSGELILGDSTAPRIPDLGETHYLPLIEAAESWIEENVVKPGKLVIPENFAITAPTHTSAMAEMVPTGPLEYTNPQTTAFCELVGIENKFHATDEERKARLMRGPAPDQRSHDGGFGRDRGRGGRGGRGGGRGRGRGGFGGRGRDFRGRGGGRGS